MTPGSWYRVWMPRTWRWEWTPFPRGGKAADSNDRSGVRQFLQHNRTGISMTTGCGQGGWLRGRDNPKGLTVTDDCSFHTPENSFWCRWRRRWEASVETESEGGEANNGLNSFRLGKLVTASKGSDFSTEQLQWFSAFHNRVPLKLVAFHLENQAMTVAGCVVRWGYSYC